MVLALFGRVLGSGDVERSTRKERTGLRGFWRDAGFDELEAMGLRVRVRLDIIASVSVDELILGIRDSGRREKRKPLDLGLPCS